MKIPLQKQIGQLADCKAATHKKQHSAIRRKLPHQDDPGRQRAEHFCLLFRQKQGENGQRQRQMQRPGGIHRPEGHFGRADRPHLHQDRKPLYTQCRTAECAGPIARAGSKIAPGTDFQKHRAGRAHGRRKQRSRSGSQHPEEEHKAAEFQVGQRGLRQNAIQAQLRHFLLFRARRSPFFVSVCPAQSGKQSRTEVIGRDLCQKQQNAHLCAAQQGLSHRQDDKGRSRTDAGREKPVRFFRCHLTGAHRLGRSVRGRGKAAQESHQQHPGCAGSIHSHQPCHRPKWQGQHIPQRALDEQCRHHKKRIQREQQRTAAEGQSLPQCLRAGFWCRKRECPDQNSQHQGYQPGKVLGLIHTHTLRFHIYVAPGAALHSGREGADVARKRRQHISPTGWFQRLFRQPPANFYGRTSVYLSGSILEIEHFRRIRSYDDGELCLELGKGLLTIYGSQLKITALSTQRITLRGEILRTEFSRDATSR